MLLTWRKDAVGEETTIELDAKMKKICERTTYLQICRDVEDTAPSLAVSPLLAPICHGFTAARRGHSCPLRLPMLPCHTTCRHHPTV